jgi:hypothetical protein
MLGKKMSSVSAVSMNKPKKKPTWSRWLPICFMPVCIPKSRTLHNSHSENPRAFEVAAWFVNARKTRSESRCIPIVVDLIFFSYKILQFQWRMEGGIKNLFELDSELIDLSTQPHLHCYQYWSIRYLILYFIISFTLRINCIVTCMGD